MLVVHIRFRYLSSLSLLLVGMASAWALLLALFSVLSLYAACLHARQQYRWLSLIFDGSLQ
jgi:hypothetical protein